MEDLIQIEPAEVTARISGSNIGAEGLSFATPEQRLGDVAPYLGRVRSLNRIACSLIARFTPAASTAEAPEVLRLVFQLCRLGQVIFVQTLELNRVLLLPSGQAFYEGDITADLTNPILVGHADPLGWQVRGVLGKQEGKTGVPTLVVALGYELEVRV